MSAWVRVAVCAEALLHSANPSTSFRTEPSPHLVIEFIVSLKEAVTAAVVNATRAAEATIRGMRHYHKPDDCQADMAPLLLKTINVICDAGLVEAIASVQAIILQMLPALMLLVPRSKQTDELATLLTNAIEEPKYLGLFMRAQMCAMSAPVLKILLPLSAWLQVSHSGQPPLLRAATDCLPPESSLNASWKTAALLTVVTTGARVCLHCMKDCNQTDSDVQDLEACIDVVSGISHVMPAWIHGNNFTGQISQTNPSATSFAAWSVSLQEASRDQQERWSSTLCNKLWMSLEKDMARVSSGSQPCVTDGLLSFFSILLQDPGKLVVSNRGREQGICAALQVFGKWEGFFNVLTSWLFEGKAADVNKTCGFVFDILAIVHKGDVCAHVAALSRLLRPESQCPVDVRLRALSAIEKTVMQTMDVLEPGDDELAAACWSPEAISNLQFTALHDQAVKIRRATMHTFSLVAVPNDQSSGLVRMLVCKIRDRDVVTASRALVLLLQLPCKLLAEHCSLTEWASIVRVCMTRLASGAAPVGKAVIPSEPTMQAIKKFMRCIIKDLTANYSSTTESGPTHPFTGLYELKRTEAIAHVMHPTRLFLSIGLPNKVVEAAIVEFML